MLYRGDRRAYFMQKQNLVFSESAPHTHESARVRALFPPCSRRRTFHLCWSPNTYCRSKIADPGHVFERHTEACLYALFGGPPDTNVLKPYYLWGCKKTLLETPSHLKALPEQSTTKTLIPPIPYTISKYETPQTS